MILRPALAVLCCAALILSGCHGGGSHAGSPGSAGSLGAPPDANTPDSSLLAPAAPRPSGTPQQAAAVLAEAAAGSGAAAQGALRTALAMSGFGLMDVGGAPAGEPADKPVMGIDLPAGQVAMMTGQNHDDHGMSASDISGVLRLLMVKPVPETQLRQAVLNGLREQAAAGTGSHKNPYPKTVQFLSAFIVDLGRDASPPVDVTGTGMADIPFTSLQSWLLLLGIAGGMAQAGSFVHDHHSAPPVAPAGLTRPGTGSLRLVADKPCTIDDTTGKVMDWAAIAFGLGAGGIPFSAWGGLAGLIKPSSETNAGNPYDGGDYLSWASGLLTIVRAVVESTSFTATMEMEGGQPLVRTKETNRRAEQRILKLHASFDIGRGQYANCLRLMLNQAGLDFSLPNDGPIKGANVMWEMSQDPEGVLNNPTEFYVTEKLQEGANGAGVASTTDDNGDATVGLEGMPQRHELPPDPKPYTRTVDIYASLKIKDESIYNDLTDAISTLGAGAGAIASIITGLLEHTHAFSVHKTFQVKDWVRDYKVDMYADDFDPDDPHRMVHVTATKCDGLGGTWTFDVEGRTFQETLDDDGNGTTAATGAAAFGLPPLADIHFEDGSSPKLIFSYQGYQFLIVPLIPGNYCPAR